LGTAEQDRKMQDDLLANIFIGNFSLQGGKTQQEFLQEAIERSSPGNARFLAELFGGLELNLELQDGAQV